MRRSLLLGGSVQVVATIGLVLGAMVYIGLEPGSAAVIGFMASLSSTAIVLKLLEKTNRIDSSLGRISLAILIFQDIAVVAMLLAIPLLISGQAMGHETGLSLFFKGIATVVVLIFAAKWGVGRLLDATAKHHDRELFAVTVAVVLLGVAWLTSWAGLSLALGAFVAGLIVSESLYGPQAVSNVIPLRDLFTSIFFVSVGMLLDVGYLIEKPLLVAMLTVGLLLGKTLTAGLAAALLGYNLRICLGVGLSLSQVGEFSFVLARTGHGLGLISNENFQLALAASVITMMLTPPLLWLGQKTASKSRRGRRASSRNKELAKKAEDLNGHLVIVGYGINGHNVTRAADIVGIPYIVVEMNPVTVKREQKLGVPIFYGDALNQAVLEHAGLVRAQALVITLADPMTTRRIVAASRSAHPGLYIIARTRYMQDIEELVKAGADEIIPEEYQTALEIFTRVLRRFGTPETDIAKFVDQIISDRYEIDSPSNDTDEVVNDIKRCLGGVQITTFWVQPGSTAEGSTLRDLQLRQRFGMNVLGIRRHGQIISDLQPEQSFESDDILIVLAALGGIYDAENVFKSPSTRA